MGGGRAPEGEGDHLSAAGEDFAGLRVLALESRRATEIAELVRRRAGEPVNAPSMREIPLGENPQALAFARRLRAGEIDAVVLLTGVGTRALVEAVSAELDREAFAAALGSVTLVARGPKPVAALRELGLAATIAVGEPNTWRELLAAIDAKLAVAGRTIAIQEYGEPNPELESGFAERGATVISVPVYRWALPLDLGPLERAIDRVLEGSIDVLLVTSATQIEHLFRVAGPDRADPLVAALRRVVVCSIGPIASEALRRRGIAVDFEASPPKMGPLVLGAAACARKLHESKRMAPSSTSGRLELGADSVQGKTS